MDPKEFKVLVGALTFNNAKYIIQVLKNIERYVGVFGDYECWFIDGYSKDGTDVILKSWCKQQPDKRKIEYEGTFPPQFAVNRNYKLTALRQRMIDTLRPKFDEKVVLMLLDTDSVNAGIVDIEGFKSNFTRNDWAAVFANQPTEYYDVWALRDENLPFDWQIEARYTGDWSCHKKYQTPKPSSTGFWPVTSAFGGAALYRTHLIPVDAKYEVMQQYKARSGQVETIPICEHVPFNEAIVKAGGKLFINCKWMIKDHDPL